MRLERANPAVPNWHCPDDPELGAMQRYSICDDERNLLTDWARGRVVLELGTGLGISTRSLAESAVHVDTVDPSDWVRDNVALGLPGNVTFHPTIPAGRWDLVFIDGLHDWENTRDDVTHAEERLLPGGIVLIHDANQGDVQRGIAAAGWQIAESFNTAGGLARIERIP